MALSRSDDGKILVERVRLDGRGRVPLPSPIRRWLGLRDGENLVWVVDQDNDLLHLMREQDAATLLSTHLKERSRNTHAGKSKCGGQIGSQPVNQSAPSPVASAWFHHDSTL